MSELNFFDPIKTFKFRTFYFCDEKPSKNKMKHKASAIHLLNENIAPSFGKIQKQPFADVLWNKRFLKCRNIHSKTPLSEYFFHKVAGFQVRNFIKKRLWILRKF